MKDAINPLQLARDVLFPWSQAANRRGRKPYPGAFYGVCQLVGNRAAIASVNDWLMGRRRAPRWLTKLMWDAIEQNIQRERKAQQALADYQHGPGTGESLRRWHQKKRAAEAALRSYQQEN